MNPLLRKVFVLGFFVTAFLATLALFFYQESVQVEKSMNQEIAETYDLQFAYIEGVISENYQKAKTLGDDIASKVRTDILSVYQGNTTRLEFDLTHWDRDNHPVTNILASRIKGVYMNGIENDNNDPFALTKKDGIISDFSLNCSADGRTRTFDQEAALHSDPALAKKAIEKILVQSVPDARSGGLDRLIGWSFLKPLKPEYKVEDFTIQSLRDLFLRERTIDCLASFEFLYPVYIDYQRDLLGVPNVSVSGQRNENSQLVIVIGWNLVDQLKANDQHLVNLTQFDTQVKVLRERYESLILMKQLIALGIVLMFFVTFIGVNLFTEMERKREKDRA